MTFPFESRGTIELPANKINFGLIRFTDCISRITQMAFFHLRTLVISLHETYYLYYFPDFVDKIQFLSIAMFFISYVISQMAACDVR